MPIVCAWSAVTTIRVSDASVIDTAVDTASASSMVSARASKTWPAWWLTSINEPDALMNETFYK